MHPSSLHVSLYLSHLSASKEIDVPFPSFMRVKNMCEELFWLVLNFLLFITDEHYVLAFEVMHLHR